jgi:hypothetical protein
MKHFGAILGTLLLITVVLLAADRADACSAVSCVDHGVEVAPRFTVTVKHDNTPLAGVTIEVTSTPNDGNSIRVFSGVTASDGTVHVSNFAPGDYWITADLFGINAAYHCFHIEEKPSRIAKRSLKYEWGDLAPAAKHVAGKLIDSQPGKGGTAIWNLVHRIEVPISGAYLTLRNPLTGTAYRTASDGSGIFSFGDIQSGTYVLHIEGGNAGERSYDGTDLLLAVSPKAHRDALLLTHRDAGGGSCGGTSLELVASQAR